MKALPEREHLNIKFPRVEGFVYQVENKNTTDIFAIEPPVIDPRTKPTETVVRARIGYQVGTVHLAGVGEPITQSRQEFYDGVRL